jgi:hypothetical protein
VLRGLWTGLDAEVARVAEPGAGPEQPLAFPRLNVQSLTNSFSAVHLRPRVIDTRSNVGAGGGQLATGTTRTVTLATAGVPTTAAAVFVDPSVIKAAERGASRWTPERRRPAGTSSTTPSVPRPPVDAQPQLLIDTRHWADTRLQPTT